MRKKKTFLYGSILSLATLQFDGHFLQHFIENSEKVVAFYNLPRGGGTKNFIELYLLGKRIEKREVVSPKNIIVAYITLYIQYIMILSRYFTKDEKFYFINFIPVFFFFNSIVQKLRNIEIIYWVQDFWPMQDLSIRIFRFFMHFYHSRMELTIYVSDRINRLMNNGKLLNEWGKHTVMLGINSPKKFTKDIPRQSITLCFIGVIVESQGINLLLNVVAQNQSIRLKLIGTGEQAVVAKYKKLVERYNMSDRVFFPNRFYYGEELKQAVSDCHVGVALYVVDSNTVTYFADPAKIKQYAEFGLPIIMTNAAEVAQYIKRFKAGIIVERNVEAINRAIEMLKNDYPTYLAGLQKFNKHFNYRIYYKKAFRFLERVRG